MLFRSNDTPTLTGSNTPAPGNLAQQADPQHTTRSRYEAHEQSRPRPFGGNGMTSGPDWPPTLARHFLPLNCLAASFPQRRRQARQDCLSGGLCLLPERRGSAHSVLKKVLPNPNRGCVPEPQSWRPAPTWGTPFRSPQPQSGLRNLRLPSVVSVPDYATPIGVDQEGGRNPG